MNQQPESNSKWPLERALFLMAGTMTILSAVLVALLSPWFLLLTGFVGLSQLMYVVLGACPASLVLRRACGLKSAWIGNSNAPEAR